MIEAFGSHLNIELQQRGVEFTALVTRFDHLRPALLERMPPMPVPSTRPRTEQDEPVENEEISPSTEQPADNDTVSQVTCPTGMTR